MGYTTFKEDIGGFYPRLPFSVSSDASDPRSQVLLPKNAAKTASTATADTA